MSETKNPIPAGDEAVVERVRERYAGIAESSGCCCSCAPEKTTTTAGRLGYAADELATLPPEADLGLGCGAPVELLAPAPGETVLDLGSGPGLDALLAARRVGPEGRVIGVDMTPEMIERARAAAASAGLEQVEFRRGRLEKLPVEDSSVDAVTSNCVINLVPDKRQVFREAARVLKPGGRMVISDIVLDAPLPEAVANDLLAWVGCVAGALPRAEYFAAVRDAGLEPIEILDDRDALSLFGDEVPSELTGILDRAGAAVADLRGTVRSVTWRAHRPRGGYGG